MNIAICTSTPYQTLNAIIMRLSVYNHDNVDLYYRNFSKYSDFILSQLRSERIFDNIFEWNFCKTSNSIFYVNQTIQQCFFPRSYVTSQTKNNLDYNKQYDKMSITVGNFYEIALIKSFHCDSIFTYEDGFISYSADYLHSHNRGKIWNLLNGRFLKKIKPQTLFLHRPEFYGGNSKEHACQIPEYYSLDSSACKMIDRIFGYRSNDDYSNSRVVFLTQPWNEVASNAIDVNEEIFRILNNYRFIIRKHPRDNYQYCFDTNIVIDEGGSWELTSLDVIGEKHILIAMNSTSQLIPKLLSNKEPYLIYTYKMYKIHNEEFLKNAEIMVKKAKLMYNNNNKIYVPNTIEDFRSIINSLIN